ncbi:uncharacterized protein Z519_12535 [Cladophialophora bantiana CBS 173.52]|uniref:AMMECR1 domain-containing protein n=1 Tax=Cladophialophora bantiana (strain ATCC 10958 / CBS 173.52 / CDC B-1940 / NIH 8579) TaxID=1442370 RepID=A0A0D2H0W3_CLAB1|nr:uncharacterized protein Z519_12535 [Cladophialophora bantiana CBS 173.52]KIW86913.1 hypothetical protein Z519_12535 [Cladophialophora bantiana CBS 173.52]
MASPAHCLYCFEVLSASFERRDPPTLHKVLELYENYQSASQPDGIATGEEEAENDKDRVKVTESEDEHEAGDEEEEEEEQEDDDEAGEEEIQRFDRRHSNSKAGPQLPSISRLQASSSSSRSSSASSPSLFSASSSNSQLTTPSSTTSSSSHARPTYASQLSATESFPLFVTWNTVARSGHKALRGCIGTFEALPLASGLTTYALTSAFDDTRFSPIPAALLPALSCSLTLLADFEPCRDAMDWTLGRHGLRISFNYRSRRHGATYLPDVAVEQGWTKEETVESLMKKAGWDGGVSGHGVARRLLRGSIRGSASDQQPSQPSKPWEEVQDFRAIRYTGLKSSATYSEWQDWREWAEKNGVK